MSPESRMPDYVIVGTVLRPHGIRGELKVAAETDDPQRFNRLDRVFLRLPDGEFRQAQIEHVKIIDRGLLVVFKGIDTRTAAETLRGATIEIPGSKVLPLPEGKYYYFELIGLQVVTQDGELVGTIKDIVSYPANDVYVVATGERDILVPDSPDIIREIDVRNRRLVIHPMPGLLD
ncbi:16S rRNA processing protein RimM [candidate division KSB1 bacterium]|nr:16S rRNA processing protein RimM [candidate division KSB1 bacterium]